MREIISATLDSMNTTYVRLVMLLVLRRRIKSNLRIEEALLAARISVIVSAIIGEDDVP